MASLAASSETKARWADLYYKYRDSGGDIGEVCDMVCEYFDKQTNNDWGPAYEFGIQELQSRMGIITAMVEPEFSLDEMELAEKLIRTG